MELFERGMEKISVNGMAYIPSTNEYVEFCSFLNNLFIIILFNILIATVFINAK